MIFDFIVRKPNGEKLRCVAVICDEDGCMEREDYPGSYSHPEAAAAVRDKRGWGIVCVRAERPQKFEHYCPTCDRLRKVSPAYLKYIGVGDAA